jgi:SET domain-containing protein
MGLMSYCNHSEKPNAEIVWEEKLGTVYHTLQVTRDIPKHTEICTSYGAGWFDDRKKMFSGK